MPPMIWNTEPDRPPTAVLKLMRRSRVLPKNRSAMNEDAIGKIMPRPRPSATARGKQDVEALGRFGHEGREAAQEHEDHGDDEDGLLLHVALQDADQDGPEDGHQGRDALDLLDHDGVDAHFLIGTAHRRQGRRDEGLHILHDDDAQCGDLDGPAVQGTTLGVLVPL